MVISAIHQFMDLNQLHSAIHLILVELVVDISVVLHVMSSKFLVLVGFIVTKWAEALADVVIWEEWEWFALPSANGV
jgi:hypothetical protein